MIAIRAGDADGGNIYLLSQNNEPDFVPSLLGDGRVIMILDVGQLMHLHQLQAAA